MKKVYKLLPLLLIAALGMAGCSKSEPVDTRDPDIVAVYNLYVENGGTLSYDEWMESITGAKGDPGDNGQDGKDGKSVLTGQGVPSSNLGISGDTYIDLATWDIYRKVDAEWIKVGNIKGLQGENGAPGEDGKPGENGNNGASAYEIYIAHHPEYEGTEEQWYDDLANGRLADQVTHIVTFDSNGGSEVAPQTVLHGEKATKPEDPTLKDYTFEGWYDEHGDKWVFNGYGVYDDITLTANWTQSVYLKINPAHKTIYDTESFAISYSVMPLDTTIMWSSSNEDVATVTTNGRVSAVAPGNAVITAIGSNGKAAVCSVTVIEYVPDTEDIWVDKDLHYTGSLTIGAPQSEQTLMASLLADFNKMTGSSINFTVVQFEDDNGMSGYSSPTSMPAIFPYTNYSLIPLLQGGALSTISKTSRNMIKSSMPAEAYNASGGWGYPYKADTAVAYYDSSVIAASDISSFSKMFQKASELGRKVSYPIVNAYYIAPILNTFSSESLYTCGVSTEGKYTFESTFASENGVSGAKLLRNIAMNDNVINDQSAPTSKSLVTITTTRNNLMMKQQLGNKYGVAPMPYDSDSGLRPRSFNDYVMYGINKTLSSEYRTIANHVALFLASPYCQNQRFDTFQYIPTISEFLDYEGYFGEPVVSVYRNLLRNNEMMTMYAIPQEFWATISTAAGQIKSLSPSASDSDYLNVLTELDTELHVE